MTALAHIPTPVSDLPGLIERAAQMLSGAKTAAEVLEAREAAGLAYDVAKRAARLKCAKAAHDDLVAAAHRAQADALEIEAAAKRRLADEYDAAQTRGEVHRHGGQLPRDVADPNIPSVSELGLRRDQIHEARQLRDAEAADPGILRRTLDDRLEHGEEPTRTARFMRRKGVECLSEADRLDALFAAVAAHDPESGTHAPQPSKAEVLS